MRRVVVTGIGAVTPIGNNVNEFWTSILSGKVGISEITKFDTRDFKVKIAAEVKNFDPKELMDKSEARKEDTFSQYALVAAKEAIEDSHILSSGISPERLGVYVGSGTGGMNTFCREYDKLMEKGPSRVSPFFVPMMIGNMATGNIARIFNAQGPSLPIITACATSTHAIGEAYRAIQYGHADAIIAGGAEAAIVPLAVAGFTNATALTKNEDPKTACRPFDKNRDGFVIGEGSGILVLEEYERAKSRGANIYGEICGYGNTNDAFHMTAPDAEAKASSRAISLAFDESGMTDVKADEIYINAHGTSTPLNDKTETVAIKKVFGEEAKNINISSTKSMTGHMLGAAGAVEAIATILALKNSVVPPTMGYKEADEDCDLNYTPNQKIEKNLEVGLSTSLGFGGHNGCLCFKKV